MTTSSEPKPPEIFISYKRNLEPDSSLAGHAFDFFQKAGHRVFIDRTIKVGQEWAREIEAKVRSSDFLLVFLTAASASSEMVRSELEIARDQAATAGRSPRILPIRLAYIGPLPYPISAWLDPLQYALWRGDADTGRVIRELAAAIAGADLPTAALIPTAASARDNPPLYSAPLPPPGGGLDQDDPWYISRASDHAAIRTIQQQGVTLVIKGSRQMGKTSLLVRVLGAALLQQKRCLLLDFQMFGKESLTDSTTFFRRFGRAVADGLDVQADLRANWDHGLSDPQNLTRFMERVVLKQVAAPVVIAIDEADILFQADFLYDFFGMLRSWHNLRANPLKKQIWKKLDLVLVTSTEPYLFIDRDHESPFNVGEIISLTDFSVDQVHRLNELHQTPLFVSEVDRLHDLLNGQPYLTRRAFYLVKSGQTPGQLLAAAAEDAGPFGDHLRNYFLRLLNYPELAGELKQVTLGRGCSDRKLAYRLESAGLVKSHAGKTVPRCSLYAQYFGERL